MKIGLIFKKEFHEVYGQKQEFHGFLVSITRNNDDILIYTEKKDDETYNKFNSTSFPVNAIQLIYLGEWK